MLNADTTSCEQKQLEMLAFRVETNGFPTLSWIDLMSSIVILIEVASSRLSSMSRNTNTQLAAGFNASSIVCRVASTREDMLSQGNISGLHLHNSPPDQQGHSS